MPKQSNKTPRRVRGLEKGNIATYDRSTGMWFVKSLKTLKIRTHFGVKE